MAAVSQYRKPPFSLEPGPGFLRTLGVLAHEVGHQWLAEARYKVGDTVFDDLLGSDDAHWSYLLDSDASLLYGADWRDNRDGTFKAARIHERYSALDLYLMGMLPRNEWRRSRCSETPRSIATPTARATWCRPPTRSITIDQIVARRARVGPTASTPRRSSGSASSSWPRRASSPRPRTSRRSTASGRRSPRTSSR